jgi:hypothetical protein
MKQWCDDVDRLLGMAHSGSTRSRPRSSRRQHEATTSVRSPSVRGAQTDDLRAEHNRRRAGEDARVSLEKARERRRNIEGRNVDQDFTVVAPQTPAGARIQAGVPLVDVGCATLADHLRAANLATQVLAAPAGKVRRYDQPIGILAGVRHRHYGSGWRHRRNGNIFSCCLIWPCPDLAHESYPRINIFLGRALRAVRSELRQCLSAAWHGGSPPCSEAGAWGNSPDLHLSLHQSTRDYTPYLRRFHHHRLPPGGCVMKKCWRSWPCMTWKLSPRFLLWLISAPGPPRVMHVTRHHRPGLPRWVARVPSLRTAKRKRRRTTAPRGRRLLLRSSQLRLGAKTSAISTHSRREVTAAHVMYTPTVALAPWSVTRSSNSRSASAIGASRPPRTAPLLAAGLARKGLIAARWPRENRTSGISHPRGS